jgi:serine/threonine protein phosphatase PrpC
VQEFVATNMKSGCTSTVCFLHNWTLTVGNVGDSAAYLDTGHEIVKLSADHRLDENEDEMRRLYYGGQVDI